VSRRALIIAGVVFVGVLGAANIVVLTLYLPRLMKSAAAKPLPAQTPVAAAPAISPAAAQTLPPSSPAPAATVHAPLPVGAVVQRQEVSPSGKIRIKYVRSKGNPVRQIVLESVARPQDSTVFFEHQRNAWLLVSPNDEWIALNNRPKPAESELQVYHRTNADSLKYEIPEDFRGDDRPLETAVWNYYLQTMGLPEDTQPDGVIMDATGWDNDSRKLAISVTVVPGDPDDKVPPPWNCTFDVASQEIEMSDESAQALKQQEAQGGGEQSAGLQTSAASGDSSLLQGTFTGERFPVTRLRLLEENELSNWNSTNVRYAINEMYARRGYDFGDSQEVKRQFSKFSWYQPRAHLSMTEIESEFSDVERQNVKLLGKFRDVGKSAGRRQQRPVHGQRVQTPNPGEEILRSVLQGMTGGSDNR
jgi:YARHG domain